MKLTLPIFIALFAMVPLVASCSGSKDKAVPDKKIKEVLKRHFQEQFIKLECIGNNETFRFLENNEVVPEKASLTFKAKVNIKNVERTVVGKINISAFVSGSGFGRFYDHVIGFTSSLGDWHFPRPDEDTQNVCPGESLLSVRRKEGPFRFDEHNSYFGATHRLPIELDIGNKLCDYGEKEYCKYIYDYKMAKVPTRGITWNSVNERDLAEMKRDKVNMEFAQRYYARLCDNNVSIACSELNKIEENSWKMR